MLRHSISQIFGANKPSSHDENMFSSLQPARPMVPVSAYQSPLHQQPIRHTTTTTTTLSSPISQPITQYSPLSSTSTFTSSTSQPTQPPVQPRTQIEALPPPPFYSDYSPLPTRPIKAFRPTSTPHTQPSQVQLQGSPLDPSRRHPVFFTPKLHKAPKGVWAGRSSSPVATGYVWNEQERRSLESGRL